MALFKIGEGWQEQCKCECNTQCKRRGFAGNVCEMVTLRETEERCRDRAAAPDRGQPSTETRRPNAEHLKDNVTIPVECRYLQYFCIEGFFRRRQPVGRGCEAWVGSRQGNNTETNPAITNVHHRQTTTMARDCVLRFLKGDKMLRQDFQSVCP